MSVIEDYFTFDLFISRAIIALVYFLGVVAITGASVWILIWGRTPPMSYGSVEEAFWAGFAILVFGNLIWRVLCEFVVVVFKINDSLIAIDGKMRDTEGDKEEPLT